MLTILATTDNVTAIKEAITSVDRLEELVTLIQDADKAEDVNMLVVAEGHINTLPDWHDSTPPYRMPAVPFTQSIEH